MIASSYGITYYRSSVVPATSLAAGELCQLVANQATECGYQNCDGEVVGAATHETIVKTDSGYVDGSAHVPVCERHKAWEYSKLKPVEPWGWGA